MDTIVFLTARHISHILPIESLIPTLLKQYNIICFGYVENELKLNEFGVCFIPYKTETSNLEIIKKSEYCMEKAKKLFSEKEYQKWHKLFLKAGIISNFDIDHKKLAELYIKIEEINPICILYDTADIYANIVSGDGCHYCIPYMTNNLYNWAYFRNTEIENYPIFFNLLSLENFFPSNYFLKSKEFIDNLYDEVVLENNFQKKLIPFHNFNPEGDKVIIFSNSIFQNKLSFEKNVDYLCLPPIKNRFSIEKNIPIELKEFMNDSMKKIVYISTGSFLSTSIDIYILYINILIKNEFKIIISCKKYQIELNEYIDKNNLSEIVKIYDYPPQKYILSKAHLFITSGGFNSIIESIYFKVPLIVSPMTAEQRLNGVEIENMKLGITLYRRRKKYLNFDQIISKILNSLEMKKQLQKYSNIMREESICNHDSIIYNFIKRGKGSY